VRVRSARRGKASTSELSSRQIPRITVVPLLESRAMAGDSASGVLALCPWTGFHMDWSNVPAVVRELLQNAPDEQGRKRLEVEIHGAGRRPVVVYMVELRELSDRQAADLTPLVGSARCNEAKRAVAFLPGVSFLGVEWGTATTEGAFRLANVVPNSAVPLLPGLATVAEAAAGYYRSQKDTSARDLLEAARQLRGAHDRDARPRGMIGALDAGLVMAVNDFLGGHAAGESWLSLSAWASGERDTAKVFKALQPGLGDPTMATSTALDVLSAVLHEKVQQSVQRHASCMVRAAFLAAPPADASKARRQTASRLLVKHFSSWQSKKGNCKHCLVWVARLCVVQEVLERQAVSWLRAFGVVRLVVGESHGALRVEPRIRELPECADPVQTVDGGVEPVSPHVGRRWCPVIGDEPLLIVVEANVHTELFLYSALKMTAEQLHLDASPTSQLRTLSVAWRDNFGPTRHAPLRAWLGLQVHLADPRAPGVGSGALSFASTGDMHPDICRLFGEPQSRRAMLMQLVCQNGSLGRLTEAQLDLLSRIRWPFTVLDLVAGAGKTLMLIHLAALAMSRVENPFIVFVAPTNAMSATLHSELVRRIGSDEGIVRVAVDMGSNGEVIDHLEGWFQAIANEASATEVKVLRDIDELLDAIKKAEQSTKLSQEDAAECMSLMRLLLQHRHIYLDVFYYSQVYARQAGKIATLKLAVMTVAQLMKLNGHQSQWTRWLPLSRRLLLFIDEIEELGVLEVCGSIAPFDAAVGAGDEGQSSLVNQAGEHARSQMHRKKPLHEEHASQWAKSSTVDVLRGSETWRYGPSMSSLLRCIFPTLLPDLRSHVLAPNTVVIPHLFLPLDWYCDASSNEVLFNGCLFAEALCTLALEMTLSHLWRASQRQTARNILVLWGLLRPLKHFEAIAAELIPQLCEVVHRKFLLAWVEYSVVYSVTAWIEADWLCFRPIQNAHGSTAAVVMACIVRRQGYDRTWMGDVLRQNYLYESLSRVTHRMHLFIEDLRGGVDARSERCQEVARQLELVTIPRFHDTSAFGSDSVVKRQLRLCRLVEKCEENLSEAGVPWRPRGNGDLPEIMWSRDVSESMWCSIPVVLPLVRRPLERDRIPDKIREFFLCALPKATRAQGRCNVPWEYPLFLGSTGSQGGAEVVRHAQLFLPQTHVSGGSQSHTDEPDDSLVSKAAETWRELLQVDSPGTQLPDAAASLPSMKEYRAPFEEAPSQETIDFYSTETQRNEAVSVQEEWLPFCIDAVTVHLQGEESALVMLPVACGLRKDDADPNFLIMMLAHRAFLHYQTHHDANVDVGTVTRRVVRHKKEELEVGGHRYIIAACWTDRPAFELVCESGAQGDIPRVLLHWYAAMGLAQQHLWQQTLLARCFSMKMAASVTAVCQEVMGLNNALVKTVLDSGDAVSVAVLANWKAAATAASVREPAMPCLLKTWLQESGAEGAQTTASTRTLPWDAFARTFPDLRIVREAGKWEAFKEAISNACAAVAVLAEPVVQYVHASQLCRTRPAVVGRDHIWWEGCLLFGTLDHALCVDWLRWRGVTMVVCVLGQTVTEGTLRGVHPDYAAAKAARTASIKYLDWSVSYPPAQQNYERAFRSIQSELAKREGCVYVHCKHGKDRSAFAVYALLRLAYEVDDDTARSALQDRRDSSGRCLVNIDELRCRAMHGWLQKALMAKAQHG